MIKAILQLYNEGKPNEKQSKIVKDFVALNKQLNAIDRTGNLLDFNHTLTDSLVDIRQHYFIY